MTMRSALLLFMVAICWMQARAGYNCTACDKRTCPLSTFPCPGHRAIDPCGCCEHCAKQKWEPCGGPDWELGYCDRDLQCANVIGLELVEIPGIGVCKEFPGTVRKDYFENDDINCPKQSACYRVMGQCDCPQKHTCILDFFQYSRQDCQPRFDGPYDDYEAVFEYKCTDRGCDIVEDRCVCETAGCERKFQFKDGNQCYKALAKLRCANLTCPESKPLKCPLDSVATRPHTPLGECCPTVESYCTCDFQRCVQKCPKGKRKVVLKKTDGVPGQCCDKSVCVL